MVEFLIDNGADISRGVIGSLNALGPISRAGHASTVRILLERGVIFDRQRDKDDFLHRVAQSDHAAVISVLLDSGADINSTNNFGQMVLDIAEYKGHHEIWLSKARQTTSKADETDRTSETPAWY
ncbi:hypothetical protein AWENTII_006390 [Aspergillus wentii]